MMSIPQQHNDPVHYPESDGQPMADYTLQFRWIVTIKENLDAILPDFVAGDLLWYPVQGDPRTRIAPDVLVALGRPKGDRGSYLQWKEAGVAPQVVFEILSPSNTLREMIAKGTFYARHGAQEFYTYDPSDGTLLGWRAVSGQMERIADMHGFTSPRLGIRFDLSGEELTIFAPNGERFRSFPEVIAQHNRAKAERDAAQAERDTAQAERDMAQAERDTAQAERDAAQARAEAAEAELAALRAMLAAQKD